MTHQSTICRHCQKPIPEGADICYRCNRSQGFLSAKLESVAAFISVSSMILSIALVSLSWLQFREASKQRNSADKAAMAASAAFKQATAGAGDAKLAKEEAERARDEIRATVGQLRNNIKLILEMEHLTPYLTSEQVPVKVQKVRKRLEEFAVPNQDERNKWLRSLK